MTVAKHMYAVFMVVTLVAAYYSGTLATQDTSKITIRTPSSWYLIVRDDGSAVYGYGAGGGITVDAETFNIEDVRRRLAPSLTDENVARPCFAVWIDVGEPRPAAQYTQDSETVGSLFEDARRAANAPQFDEIWARKPPVATQPSTRPTTQQTSRPDSEISRVWVLHPERMAFDHSARWLGNLWLRCRRWATPGPGNF